MCNFESDRESYVRCGDHSEPKDQQTKMLRVRRGKGRVAQQHVQPISAVFKDLYNRGHVLRFQGWTREDQIGPLGLEIGSFEIENPP